MSVTAESVETERETPRKGERWDSKVFGGTCRIMADPIEGYVIARFKGAMPFVVHLNEWHRKFKRKA